LVESKTSVNSTLTTEPSQSTDEETVDDSILTEVDDEAAEETATYRSLLDIGQVSNDSVQDTAAKVDEANTTSLMEDAESSDSKHYLKNNSELVKSMRDASGGAVVDGNAAGPDMGVVVGAALGALATVVGVGCVVTLMVCSNKKVKNPVVHLFERKHVYATMEENPLASTGHFRKPGPPVILPNEQGGSGDGAYLNGVVLNSRSIVPQSNESFQPETSVEQVTVL